MQVEPLRQDGWIGLVEFSLSRGVSLSTLRRYIKAHKIEYKVENGKYLLNAETVLPPQQIKPTGPKSESPAHLANENLLLPRIELLEKELKQTREELSELKMLLEFYEDKLNTRTNGSA